MEISAKAIKRIYTSEHFWPALIVAAFLLMHFLMIDKPPEIMFDEYFYVPDARAVLEGNGSLRLEHPPMAQLMIALSMLMFGDNAWGWRFLSVIFGALVLILFYLINRRLGLSGKIAAIAVFLLAFENLSFVQSGIAMLDVFSFAFMLLALWSYLRGNYLLTALAISISVVMKLNGALVVPIIGLHWLITRRDHPIKFILSMAIAPILFIEFLVLCDYIMIGQLQDPVNRIRLLLGQSASVTYSYANPPNASRPWEWVLKPEAIYYWYVPQYVGVVNHSIWALIIPTALYTLYKAIRRSSAGLLAILWFASTYLVWLPISLIVNRITYAYYMYQVVPMVIIGICMGISQLLTWSREKGKGKLGVAIVALYLLIHFVLFLILSPFIYQTIPLLPWMVSF